MPPVPSPACQPTFLVIGASLPVVPMCRVRPKPVCSPIQCLPSFPPSVPSDRAGCQAGKVDSRVRGRGKLQTLDVWVSERPFCLRLRPQRRGLCCGLWSGVSVPASLRDQDL